MDKVAAQTEDPPRPLEHIRLVRIIDRTIHVSAEDRLQQRDYVISNDTAHQYDLVYLPLRKFERNLKVYDEDGQILNILPNELVKEAESYLKTADSESFELLQHRFKDVKYRLGVLLPAGKPLLPQSMRSIRLEFEADYPARHHGFLNQLSRNARRRSWPGTIFNIPYFSGQVPRFPGHAYDHFFVIVGPPGYSVKGVTRSTGSAPSKDIYNNGLDDNSRNISVRLPEADKGPYDWTIDWDLTPSRSTLMRFLSIFLVVAFVSSLGSLLALIWGAFPEAWRAVSGASATTALAMVFALEYPWTDRYKVLMSLPIGLHVLAWILWATLHPAGTAIP